MDAIRVRPRSQFRNSTPVACDEQQFGSLSRPCLRKKDDTFVVSSDVKRSTRALQAATSGGEGDREAPDKQGTGTKAKIDTFPFPGDNCRSFLYRDTDTIGAAADVRVQNRDSITRNDDVEQSLKDLIVRSQPRFGDEERWPRQNKSGISQISNAWVQSRNGIAEKSYGPYSENTIPSASSHI